MLLSYAVAKLLAYWGWSTYGVGLSRPATAQSERVLAGARLGVLRWSIGVVFGVSVFLASAFVPVISDNVWLWYMAIYVPIRCIEWGIIAAILASDHFKPWSRKMNRWIVGGIAVSILVDLVHPEMIEQGRFCIGRCLC